ncbi:hypothetical protein [Saliterribacillus persicus]|uniref:Uncharacterized protein n=1 Tax=Saliterribacillus persicus TaxID=930114 RepID=A0A368XEA4_9BACI|nr:hypothetical protein [Saliterribacillus persicus]RCW66292.1 hypothetical protein DFR57_1097 [Saliterribacillus persicus]
MKWIIGVLSGLSLLVWVMVIGFYLNTSQQDQLLANMQPVSEHQLEAKSVKSNLFLAQNNEEEIVEVNEAPEEEQATEQKLSKLQQALDKLPPGEPISVDDLLIALGLNDI